MNSGIPQTFLPYLEARDHLVIDSKTFFHFFSFQFGILGNIFSLNLFRYKMATPFNPMNFYPYRPPQPRPTIQELLQRMQMDLDRMKTDLMYLLNRDRVLSDVVEEKRLFEDKCRVKINQLYNMVNELKINESKKTSPSPSPPSSSPPTTTSNVEKKELTLLEKALMSSKMYECGVQQNPAAPFFISLYFDEMTNFTQVLKSIQELHEKEDEIVTLQLIVPIVDEVEEEKKEEEKPSQEDFPELKAIDVEKI